MDHPRLELFSVAGFRSLPFDNPPVLELKGLTMLTGMNSSGKSSLMMALHLLQSSVWRSPHGGTLLLTGDALMKKARTLPEVFHDRLFSRAMRFRFALAVDGRRFVLEHAYLPPVDRAFSPHRAGTTAPAGPFSSMLKGIELPGVLVCQRTGWAEVDQVGSDELWSVELEFVERGRDEPGAGSFIWRHKPDELVGSPWPDAFTELDDRQLSDQQPWRTVEALHEILLKTGRIDSIRATTNWSPNMAHIEDIKASDVNSDGSTAMVLLAKLHIDGTADAPADHPLFQPLERIEAAQVPAGSDASLGVITFEDQLNFWLKRLGLDPIISAGGPGNISEPTTIRGEMSYLFQGLGDGALQVLPVLLQGLRSQEGDHLFWEHPDLHLHPASIVVLAELTYLLAKSGRTLLVETHSKDFIKAVQVLDRDECRASETVSSRLTIQFLYRTANRLKSLSFGSDELPEYEEWPPGMVADRFERLVARVSKRPRTLSRKQILDLIARGESSVCEFKSHLRYDIRTARNEKYITVAVVRAICAFLNCVEGGTVLIGVSDDGGVVGLEPDKYKDYDVVQRTLPAHLHSMSTASDPNCIRMSCAQIECKMVIAVDCVMSSSPVFLRGQTETFPVRQGTSVKSMPVSDITPYINKYWPDSRL